jgi:hypothetical protein
MERKIIFLIAVGSLFLILIPNLEAKEDILKVWDFNQGIANHLNGFYNTFEKKPSSATTSFNYEIKRGKGGKSLEIDYFKDGGFCGVWMHLFNSEAPEEKRKFVDASTYPYLSFFVRGKRGGEDFSVQMADVEWLKKEDSLSAGRVSEYLAKGITTEWQEVVIPIEDFGLETTQLATLVFNFTEGGKGTIFIDDISFKKEESLKVPKTETETKVILKKYNKAMWVWESLEPLLKKEKREELFKFCQEYGINELFFQLQYRFVNEDSPLVSCQLKYPDEQRAFLKEANKRGIKVHALDGYPEFALLPWHPKVLAQVKAIIEFNKKGRPDERYYGIHLDNEPYQLLGFGEPGQKQKILKEFLDLNKKCMELIEKSETNLVFGVDVPFWWDEKDSTGKNPYTIEYNGEVKPVIYHLIDMLDNVGIMDYRDRADGADGIIRHGLGEIEYAAKKGKNIYIGVETFKYKPIKIFFLAGMPRSEFSSKMKKTNLGFKSQIGRFKIRLLDDGVNLHAGLAFTPDLNGKINSEFKTALLELGSSFSQNVWLDRKRELDSILFDAEWKIGQMPEYEGFEIREIKDDKRKILYVGFEVTEVMLEKITFAGYPKSYLDKQLRQAALFFSSYPSFYGFAIHYYKTYKEMPSD